jgi:hypothetical protein
MMIKKFFATKILCWVMPCSVKQLLACWWSSGRSRSAVVWKMVPLCIMWCIWSERNNRCFEDSSRSIEELLPFFSFYPLFMDCGLAGPEGDLFFRFPLFSPLSPFVYPLCTKGCAPLRFFLIHSSDLSKKKRCIGCHLSI